jgi:drug/metabolite transporter (DMT)-like permease
MCGRFIVSPPTKMETYAHVNPVVAVVIGHFLAGEPLTRRTVLGTLLVLVSVVVITTPRACKATTGPPSKA